MMLLHYYVPYHSGYLYNHHEHGLCGEIYQEAFVADGPHFSNHSNYARETKRVL